MLGLHALADQGSSDLSYSPNLTPAFRTCTRATRPQASAYPAGACKTNLPSSRRLSSSTSNYSAGDVVGWKGTFR